MLLAGAFVYCCVLGLQGFAAQLLPRRLFLRASSWLQMAAFCVIVCVYCLQPMMPPDLVQPAATGCSHGRRPIGFWACFNSGTDRRRWRCWRGGRGSAWGSRYPPQPPPMRSLYFRTLRKIVEEPDIVGGAVAARGCRAWATQSKPRWFSSVYGPCCAAGCIASYSPSI